MRLRPVLGVVLAGVLTACGSSAAGRSESPTTDVSTSTMVVATTTTTASSILAPGTKDSLQATPSDVAVGRPITVSGEGCRGDQVQGEAAGNGFAHITPAPGGSWSVHLTVGDGSEIGDVAVEAVCLKGTGAVFAHYDDFTVHVTTPRHLELASDTPVHPGDTVKIRAVGSCPLEGGAVYVMMRDRHTEWVDAKLAQDAGEDWVGQFVVPPAVASGTYELTGECLVFRIIGPPYSPVPLTVLASD